MELLERQQTFFASGKTLSIDFRIEQLTKLKALIKQYYPKIVEALKLDLNKSEMESNLTEILLINEEIDFIVKHLKKWARPTRVPSRSPMLWPGCSKIYYQPYGTTLIIAPWNYPFLLLLSPLIGAISAGNCAVIKPSEIAEHSEQVLVELINDHFAPEYIHAVKGGHEVVTALLQEKFDYLFFTGGTEIGKIIMLAAAKNLTPLTLELGGKSPCIVDESANLEFAARRIIWGKFMNAGQTCIAPDYIYVHHSVKDQLITQCKKVIQSFFGGDPAKSASYPRIINQKHFDRITRLMTSGNIIVGGATDAAQLYIEPTLIEGISWNDPIMQEEIFGPLLPIITYTHLDEIIQAVRHYTKPLSLYLFTKNKENEAKVLSQVAFGGGCINDCLLHIANPNLPFGGVGLSGMGRYHGRYSFETFSHQKSVYRKYFSLDMNLQYPPYTSQKLKWIKLLLLLG